MKCKVFTVSHEFLVRMLEKHPENDKFIELYSRLLEFKSEYDLQTAQLNSSLEAQFKSTDKQ